MSSLLSFVVPFVVAALYYLCFAFLMVLVGLVAVAPRRERQSCRPWSPVLPAPEYLNGLTARRLFLLLALSLLLWQLTLFWEARTALPSVQLWLGRLNFAAVALAVFLAWRFVQEVAASARPWYFRPASARTRWLYQCLCCETTIVTLITLGTPLVDEAESVVNVHAVTQFGPFFPLYLLHVLGYLAATLFIAFQARGRTAFPSGRGQLTLIGFGTLVTGGVSLITNALLPYAYGNFRFCDVGTLSIWCFLLSVAYAIFVHGLFEIRVMVRAALVYGMLLALVLGAYGSAVFMITQYLTDGAGADRLTQFAVLFIAFSFDPLRRFLEAKTDRLLFGENSENRDHRQCRNDSRLLITSLFAWRCD
jgi:hypothetical protein